MPIITKPSNHFQVVTATGANIKSACEAVFGDGLYVIKDRANSNNWQWIDYVRGTSAVLQSNTTAAETTYSAPSGNSVGFCWKANGAGVSNTDGSITSTVSANQEAGFSIVTYTGNGSAGATVGHGLGVAPSLILPKVRSRSGDNWHCYHRSLGGTQGILLNSTNAASSDSGFWNNTNPSSSVITLGAYNTFSSQTYVAYCFAEIPGYSKFGSYTGNGSTDGPFVYTGGAGGFLLMKNISAGSDWWIHDGTRSPYNVVNGVLFANGAFAEYAVGEYILDFTANGFKIRDQVATVWNVNGNTYIYAWFARNPFGGSNCSPSPAR